MQEKYTILRESNTALTGYIYISNNKGTIELNPKAEVNDIPFNFRREFRQGIYQIDSQSVFEWIVQRIPPQYRQDITDVLKELGLKEYNEFELFKVYRGKSVRDDFYIKKC